MTAAAHRSQLPDTVMAHAFLDALVRWAERRSARRTRDNPRGRGRR